MIALVKRLGELTYGNAILMLALTTLFWGGNTVAGRLAVGEVSPMVVVFLRWLIVAAIMLPMQWSNIRREWPLMRPYFPYMMLMAIFGFVAFNTLFYIAATQTTAVNLGIIQGSMPILVLIGSVIAFGAKVRLLQLIGILLTLAGVTLIAAQGKLEVLLALAVNPGDGIMLIACVLYSGYTLALRNRPQVSPSPSLRCCRASPFWPRSRGSITKCPSAAPSGRPARAGWWSSTSPSSRRSWRRSPSCAASN